jgi:succinate dehydrogenase / fumarate reductase cytochrome b subunit
VSTVTVEQASTPVKTAGIGYFLARRLHSLTGILFGGYVLVHLAINATLIEGSRYDGSPTIYQLQVDKIHSLPFLWVISWTAILLPIIYHTFHGFYILFNGRPNASAYGYVRNWLYLLQRISAIILVVFIAFHYLSFKGYLNSFLSPDLHFVPGSATQSTINHMHAHWWIVPLYAVGILAATFHLANGFWAAGVAWGLTVSSKAQQRWGVLCAGLFVFSTVCGMIALVASVRGKPVPIDPSVPRVAASVVQDLA